MSHYYRVPLLSPHPPHAVMLMTLVVAADPGYAAFVAQRKAFDAGLEALVDPRSVDLVSVQTLPSSS